MKAVGTFNRDGAAEAGEEDKDNHDISVLA